MDLEYTDLVNEIAENADSFEKVVVGEPLLTSDDDFKAVIQAITDATKEYDDGETAICFMGHGTEADSNQVYAKMQDMLTEEGFEALLCRYCRSNSKSGRCSSKGKRRFL